MESIRLLIATLVLTAIVLEIIWSNTRKKGVYNLRESLTNLGILVGNNLLKPIALAWSYFLFRLAEPLRPVELPTHALSVLLTFLIVELAYYWYHRLSHEIPALWTIHHTHHSSPWMNLTTAVRLSWLGKFISPLFFIPLILLGLSPEVVVACLTLGLLYQFFLHTEAIGRLGWFEGKLLNTPASHRVHHGSNPRYIDKNYGAVLIVWDRLFGTYEPETEAVRYGVTTGFISHNPFKIVLGPLVQLWRGDWKREKEVKS